MAAYRASSLLIINKASIFISLQLSFLIALIKKKFFCRYLKHAFSRWERDNFTLRPFFPGLKPESIWPQKIKINLWLTNNRFPLGISVIQNLGSVGTQVGASIKIKQDFWCSNKPQNTCCFLLAGTVEGGLRRPQTAIEDMFIRKFMVGTFPTAVLSEVIIKRQHNIIRISAIISAKILPRRACFLIGYTEELLSHWLQCIVKLEPIFENEHQKMIFKYI